MLWVEWSFASLKLLYTALVVVSPIALAFAALLDANEGLSCVLMVLPLKSMVMGICIPGVVVPSASDNEGEA